MLDTENTIQFYADLNGNPLQNGKVYFGAAGQNPVTSPISVYWDAAATQPAAQPILVKNGLSTRNGNPARVYIAIDYSKLVVDSLGRQVSFDTSLPAPMRSSLAGPNSAALVNFAPGLSGLPQLGVDVVLRSLPVSVKWFGAKGDGVTNDTAAIKAAIAAAILLTPGHLPHVHFPASTDAYMVDSGVLTPGSFVQGALFTGDGWYTSVLRFNALGGPSYMFDNGATELAQFAVFQNLGFEGTTAANYTAGVIPASAGFIRQWSNAKTQGFKFLNCRVSGFDRVMECEGGNTASENKWVDCKITHVQNYVLGLNNAQSVNHEFIATDIEVILGDTFYVKAGGGGGIHVFGGSMILQPATTKTFLRIEGPMSSDALDVFGARFEMRLASTLVDGSQGVKDIQANFTNCSIYMTEAAGAKEIVNVRSSQQVLFTGCDFPSNGQTPQYRFSETNNFGQNGAIRWENCQIGDDTSDNILFTSTFGRAVARGCRGSRVGAIAAEPFIYAVDFDLGAAGSYGIGGGGDANFEVKRVWLKAPATVWPVSNGAGGSAGDLTVRLPKNAILKGVFLRKNASGTSTAAYTLQVTNNDKTTVYATSNTDQQKNAHSITQDFIYAPVGATDNERNIRVSVTGASAGNQNNTGGFGYLEYI